MKEVCLKARKGLSVLNIPLCICPNTNRGGQHTCGNRLGSSTGTTRCWRQLLPRPRHRVSVTPLVVPICCTNNPVSSYPVFPSQSCVRFSMISSLRIVPPKKLPVGQRQFLLPLLQPCVSGTLCVCSVRPCPPALPRCGATVLKRPVFSLLHWHR